MRKITLSALRRSLFQTVNDVPVSSRTIEVKRHGRQLRLIPEGGTSKLARLRPRTLIRGRAEDLANVKVGEWHAPESSGGVTRQFARRP